MTIAHARQLSERGGTAVHRDVEHERDDFDMQAEDLVRTGLAPEARRGDVARLLRSRAALLAITFSDGPRLDLRAPFRHVLESVIDRTREHERILESIDGLAVADEHRAAIDELRGLVARAHAAIGRAEGLADAVASVAAEHGSVSGELVERLRALAGRVRGTLAASGRPQGKRR
jgi:hypothetical protein